MKTKTCFLLLALFVSSLGRSYSQQGVQSIEQAKLSNGMRVTFIPYGNIDASSMSFYINIGKKNETPGQQGLANMTAEAITFGNKNYSLEKQNEILNGMGSAVSAFSNDNYSGVSLTFLNRDMETATQVISSMLMYPLFPEAEINQQKSGMLDFNSSRGMDASILATNFARYVGFGSGNPLGRTFYRQQLGKIGPEQVRAFYRFCYTPSNIQLVVCGHVEKEKIISLLEKNFGSWKTPPGLINSASYESPSFGKKEIVFVPKSGGSQAMLRWVRKAPLAASSDLIAFDLAVSAINIRLFDVVRGKEGKTYHIGLEFSEGDNNGLCMISTQVRNEVLAGTVFSVDSVMDSIFKNGIDKGELAQAKMEILTEWRAEEQPSRIAELYNPLLYKDPNSRKNFPVQVEKITLESVEKVIRKYFEPGEYKLVIVGDEPFLKTQLSTIHPMREGAVSELEKDQ